MDGEYQQALDALQQSGDELSEEFLKLHPRA